MIYKNALLPQIKTKISITEQTCDNNIRTKKITAEDPMYMTPILTQTPIHKDIVNQESDIVPYDMDDLNVPDKYSGDIDDAQIKNMYTNIELPYHMYMLLDPFEDTIYIDIETQG